MTSSEKLDLTVIFSVTLLSVMGVSLISPSLPIIQQALQVSKEEANLIIVFFTLPGMLMAPLIGVLADRFGRKQLLLPSLVLFGVFGGFLPFLTSLYWMLAFRFLQGLGGAGLNALAVTLIGDKYSAEKRAKYIGWNASILSVGTASYPIIGGFLTDYYSWQAPFYLFLSSLIVALLVLFFFKVPPVTSRAPPLQNYFGRAIRDIMRPLLLSSLTIAFLTFIFIYGSFLTYLGYYLNTVFSASSFQIGLIFSGSSIMTGLIASQTSWYQRNLNPPLIFGIGYLSFACSFLLVLFLPGLTWFWLVSLFFGTGVGLVLPSAQMYVISNVPQERRAVVTSMLTSITRAGQTVGPIVIGFIFTLTSSYILLYVALFTFSSLIALSLIALGIKSPSP